jgi:methionyl aminopeptidase
MILVKSSSEIELIRESGRIVAMVHKVMKDIIKPGITTRELDEIAERIILENGATPAFKGYGGFPASICASVNEQVVHGFPSERILLEGDIISIDVGALKNGYYGDSAKTYPVGEITSKAEKLVRITRESFYEGLKFCRVGYRLSDISHAIQTHVEAEGFSVVRDYVGHGVGTSLHEDPQIPNYGPPGKGPRLAAGMVLAIEPMINAGHYAVRVLNDNWTVVTADGSLSAHYEHTVAITDEDPILLTTLD